MPYESITARRDEIDSEVETFAGTVTSIDDFSLAAHGHNQVTALIEYTA